MKVNWNQSTSVGNLYYRDLALGDTFRNKRGQGAVYSKVQNHRTKEEFMLELASGLLFAPTLTEVERINVDVNVEASKPKLYR